MLILPFPAQNLLKYKQKIFPKNHARFLNYCPKFSQNRLKSLSKIMLNLIAIKFSSKVLKSKIIRAREPSKVEQAGQTNAKKGQVDPLERAP